MLRDLSCSISADGRLELIGAEVRLCARILGPDLGSGALPLSGLRPMQMDRPDPPAGCAGNMQRLHTEAGHLHIVVDLFRPHGQSWLALRVGMCNQGEDMVHLHNLVPLCAGPDDAVSIHGAGPADWIALRMARQKNDVPGTYRPTTDSVDRDQARIDGAEIKAGHGVSADDAERAARSGGILAEPFLALRHAHEPDQPGLFLGMLGQTAHLTRIRLDADDATGSLRRLDVLGEFDGVDVPPGGERHTHWLILAVFDDEQEIIDDFARLLATDMQVEAPAQPPPVIYCSWYFYGPNFTQDDLAENLRHLAKRPIPIDIFQIDDGWMDAYGAWNAGPRFPDGMQAAAKRIAAAGLKPGIWTCPFVLHPDCAAVATQPGLVARDDAGQPCIFAHKEGDLYVLDPTHPDAASYLSGMYRQLATWGFRAHKLDFLRAPINAPGIRFHDRTATRAEAYRRGLRLIRQAIGPDAYLLTCGGLMEGSIGLTNAQRIGSDVRGYWNEPAADRGGVARAGHLVRIKQNVFRAWTNAFWHTDPDALQLRRRTGAWRGVESLRHLAEGTFTDDEAFTCVVNQFLGGGLVCLTERLADFAADRQALLRHIIPSAGTPAHILDWRSPGCPERFLTSIHPRACGLAPWHILTICNWSDIPQRHVVALDDVPVASARVAVFEFASQTFLGVHTRDACLEITVPAHGCRLLRVATWDGHSTMLLGTDLHLSGGGVEFSHLSLDADAIAGVVTSPWRTPIGVTIGVAEGDGLRPVTCRVDPSAGSFRVPLRQHASRTAGA